MGTGSGNGSVTSVATGTGLTGGTITTTGTLSLANTAVTAGSYTRATITVDAQGRITAAGDGAAVSLTSEVTGTLPIANGGTNAATASDARTSLGLGTAALANIGTSATNVPVLDGSGKIPNSLLAISGGLSYKGNKSLIGNPTVTVESSGNYYIISVAGTETGSSLAFAVGDWMISNGTAWQQISNSSAVTSVAGKAGAVILAGSDITTGSVAVANGGTGATTAVDARTNLGLGTAALVNTGTSATNIPVLDGTGKIPNSLLNISGLAYKGNKSLSGNPTVTLETSGNYYIISVAGTETSSTLAFAVGDWMISNGTVWQKITNSSAVASVAGKTGIVTLAGADITSGTVAIANGGTGAATASAALTNLGAAAIASPTFTGTPAAPTAATGTNTTQLATTAFVNTAAGVHAIGDNYMGGKVFFVYDNGTHGLIAALADQSTGIQWYAGTNTNTMAKSNAVGGGSKNTALIIASQGQGNSTNYAARVCNEYLVNIGGVDYGDWYLPSHAELTILYWAKRDNVAGFNLNNGNYWSSSEYQTNGAWAMNFSNGVFAGQDKSFTFYVRAIRAF